jgi:predicted metalloprotease with PDZ domain
MQTPGRAVQSVAQASFDAWVKYYRQDENTPNATVSYYTKGALVALCLDLNLRNTGHNLDEVMRGLWKRCKAGPMSQADLEAVLLRTTGRDWSKELATWVHSTQDLPLQELLTQHGLQVHQDPAQWAQRLGLRVAEANGITVKAVLRGGAAQAAGMSANDEWLGIEIATESVAPSSTATRAKAKKSSQAWRLHKLDELPLYLGEHRHCTAIVARDRQLLKLPLTVPASTDAASTTWRLSIAQADKVKAWLH